MSPQQMPSVLHQVRNERIAQDAKWGQQDHPDVLPGWHIDDFDIPPQGVAKIRTDYRTKKGLLTYTDILIEELCEAVEAACDGNKVELRAELVQVAAVAVAWVEKLDREAAK